MAYGSSLSEELDSAASRKIRGAFFTPPELANYLADWVITSSSDLVLEPACGEAEFLIASFNKLISLGASAEEASKCITGCELHAESANAALSRCANLSFTPNIIVEDFFKFRSKKRFDAILGNPPYIRFQVIESKQKDIIREVSNKTGYAVSALASAWAPFVMHAASFLKTGGRLAFVLPAELLSVNYAAPIRTFLLSEFSDISIVTFDKQVFPDVQEEIVLLLANGYHCGSAEHIKWQQASNLDCIEEARRSDYYPGQNGERWTSGLISSQVSSFLTKLDNDYFCRLGKWGNLALGTVTGNNNYFVLSKNEMILSGLKEDEVRKISPPGSSHLRKIVFTQEDYSHLVEAGKKAFVFYPKASPSEAAERYLEYGIAKNVNEGYKCKKRNPWWSVPLTSIPDAFVTYMNDFAPNICINEAGVNYLNSVHGLTFFDEYKDLGRSLFALACINSVTILSSEIEGRSYGGGVLKVEPREATKLQVPSPETVRSKQDDLLNLLQALPNSLDHNELLELSKKVDMILFDEDKPEVAKMLVDIRAAKQYLYTRRRNRGKKNEK